MSRRELWAAPASEAVLILLLAGLGWAFQFPLIFASLGPTAFEQVEKPRSLSAQPYNVAAGHLIALGVSWLAVWMVHANHAPGVMASGHVAAARVWAATFAAGFTALATLAARANQPAALATALLVALGGVSTWRESSAVVAGVLIIAAAGEPLRRQRARAQALEETRLQ